MVYARGIVFEPGALQKCHLFRYPPSYAQLALSRLGTVSMSATPDKEPV